jgi:uncharacterized protein DUF4143
MFVLDLVPAWFSNRIKRLVKAPKRYLVDPALVAAVLGLGKEAILYGPDMLGRLLDTFVAAQLRGELAASSNGPRLYHLREEQGRREVDLLIETAGGQLIGIEVKASATVTPSDARHLVWLREEAGDAFAAGIVLHTGPACLPTRRPHRCRTGFRALVIVRAAMRASAGSSDCALRHDSDLRAARRKRPVRSQRGSHGPFGINGLNLLLAKNSRHLNGQECGEKVAIFRKFEQYRPLRRPTLFGYRVRRQIRRQLLYGALVECDLRSSQT